jgi:O-antigen ligase
VSPDAVTSREQPAGPDGRPPVEAGRVYPRRPVAQPADEGVAPGLRWAFYAFVAAVPVERVGIGVEISAARIFGYLLFLLALLQPRVCFRRCPAALWWFAAYACTYTVLGAFQDLDLIGEVAEHVFRLLQLLVLFWVASNLLRFPQVARGALLSFGLACAVLAFLALAGLTTTSKSIDRTTVLGQDPNEVAGFFAFGLLTLLGLAYVRVDRLRSLRWFGWPLFAALGVAVVQTGSRGGLLALGCGLATLGLQGQTLRARVRNGLLVALGLTFLVVLSLFSEGTRQRWEAMLTTGNLAHRESLYPRAWGMFTEQPLFGWGPVAHMYELSRRTLDVHWADPVHRYRDTHNLLLYVLTATGIVGTVLLLYGLWLCVRAAWRARQGAEGILPLALVVTLLAANMSCTWLNIKVHWLILAYALASASRLAVPRVPAAGSAVGRSTHRRGAPRGVFR